MVIETSSGEQGGARRETTALSREVLQRIAAGALYPSLGVLLRSEWAALAMSAPTVTVTLNALTLGRVRLSGETARL